MGQQNIIFMKLQILKNSKFNDKYITHTTCLKIVAKNEIYNKIITIQYNYSIYSNMTIYIFSIKRQ